MGPKGFLGSVAGNEGVKVGALLLGPQDSPQPLGLFLTGSKGSGYLDRYGGVGKVDGEVCHLRYHDPSDPSLFELSVDPFPFRIGGSPRDERSLEFLRQFLQLGKVLTYDQDRIVGMVLEDLPANEKFVGVFTGNTELSPFVCQGVGKF